MTNYEDIFDAVIETIENEHVCFPLSDSKIAKIVTEKLAMEIAERVIFNARQDADIPRGNIRKWLRRHNISPIQVEKVNGDQTTEK